ncbi:MAG: hypothetical protein ACKVK3_05970 [Acidimicrobiales bacterium]
MTDATCRSSGFFVVQGQCVNLEALARLHAISSHFFQLRPTKKE